MFVSVCWFTDMENVVSKSQNKYLTGWRRFQKRRPGWCDVGGCGRCYSKQNQWTWRRGWPEERVWQNGSSLEEDKKNRVCFGLKNFYWIWFEMYWLYRGCYYFVQMQTFFLLVSLCIFFSDIFVKHFMKVFPFRVSMRFSTEAGLTRRCSISWVYCRTWFLIYIKMKLDLPTVSKWYSTSQKIN